MLRPLAYVFSEGYAPSDVPTDASASRSRRVELYLGVAASRCLGGAGSLNPRPPGEPDGGHEEEDAGLDDTEGTANSQGWCCFACPTGGRSVPSAMLNFLSLGDDEDDGGENDSDGGGEEEVEAESDEEGGEEGGEEEDAGEDAGEIGGAVGDGEGQEVR